MRLPSGLKAFTILRQCVCEVLNISGNRYIITCGFVPWTEALILRGFGREKLWKEMLQLLPKAQYVGAVKDQAKWRIGCIRCVDSATCRHGQADLLANLSGCFSHAACLPCASNITCLLPVNALRRLKLKKPHQPHPQKIPNQQKNPTSYQKEKREEAIFCQFSSTTSSPSFRWTVMLVKRRVRDMPVGESKKGRIGSYPFGSRCSGAPGYSLIVFFLLQEMLWKHALI